MVYLHVHVHVLPVIPGCICQSLASTVHCFSPPTDNGLWVDFSCYQLLCLLTEERREGKRVAIRDNLCTVLSVIVGQVNVCTSVTVPSSI